MILFMNKNSQTMQNPLKVFITEDSDLVVERLVSLIGELRDVEIVGRAQDAQEAIEAIAKLQPDLVILDVRLRLGNGITVLDRIKRIQPVPLIVVLTTYPYPMYRKKCLDAGADYFLDKTTEFEKISDIFESLGAKQAAVAQ